MRIKTSLTLLGLIVVAFIASYLLSSFLLAVLAAVLVWSLVFLVVVIFPAQKIAKNRIGFFFISVFGALILSTVLVAFLPPDSMDYLRYQENRFMYIWSMKNQIALMTGSLFVMACIYYFSISHNKFKNENASEAGTDAA